MASALFLVLTTAQPGLPGRGRQAEADLNYLIQATLLLNRSVRFVEEGRIGEINSQGTVFGRAEQYFMNLDSGMVMMVLINLTQNGKPTENFILLPFPLLKFDSTRFAYTLRVSEESLSNSPHFSYFAELYYPMEKVSDIYRKFGLINLLDQ